MNSMLIQASCLYGQEIFDSMVDWYLDNGYLYIGQDALILAQAHGYSELINGKKSLDKADAWYVQFAAGDLNRLFDVCPYPLEWVIFERRGGSKKAYNFNKLKQRLQNGLTRYS